MKMDSYKRGNENVRNATTEIHVLIGWKICISCFINAKIYGF